MPTNVVQHCITNGVLRLLSTYNV